MALTRKMLKAMGIEDEKIDQIIEAHSETVDALKNERDQYKADAEMLPSVQKELDKLKSAPDDGFKEKYEKEHADFEAYKGEIEAEKAKAEKASLYRDLLKEAGVDDKRISAVMKVADLDAIEAKDGKVVDHDKIVDSIKTEWADFIVQEGAKPADVPTPPANPNGNDPEPHSLSEALRQKYLKK